MSETSVHGSDPGALARRLVRRLLQERDLAAAGGASRSAPGPRAEEWMLQELCAGGRDHGPRRRRRACWRTLLADPAGPGASAH
jgi:hypothetical protein